MKYRAIVEVVVEYETEEEDIEEVKEEILDEMGAGLMQTAITDYEYMNVQVDKM